MSDQLFWHSNLESVYGGYVDIEYPLALKSNFLIGEFCPDSYADTIVVGNYFSQSPLSLEGFVARMPVYPDDTIDVWLESIWGNSILSECVGGDEWRQRNDNGRDCQYKFRKFHLTFLSIRVKE